MKQIRKSALLLACSLAAVGTTFFGPALASNVTVYDVAPWRVVQLAETETMRARCALRRNNDAGRWALQIVNFYTRDRIGTAADKGGAQLVMRDVTVNAEGERGTVQVDVGVDAFYSVSKKGNWRKQENRPDSVSVRLEDNIDDFLIPFARGFEMNVRGENGTFAPVGVSLKGSAKAVEAYNDCLVNTTSPS